MHRTDLHCNLQYTTASTATAAGGNFGGGGGMMQQGNGNMQQQQGNSNANSDFTPLQQAVLDVFNNDDKPEGLSVQFVARHVPNATEEQVRVRTSV
jgi:Replication protein A C terminal